jgi:hypothetical protein
MKIIDLFLNIFKSKYIIEYKIEDNIYNLVVKGRTEDDAIMNFEEKWINTFGKVYPFPKYEILSVKRFFNKIRLR